VAGQWIDPGDGARLVHSAVTGETIGSAGNSAVDTGLMLEFARNTGGPALRELSFHDRARLLKQLATMLGEHKESLYELAFQSGATRTDSMIDVDGGIGTALVFASKARRELPDDQVCLDGDIEQLSRNGTFLGQHIYTPRRGVAVHINAFNFPVWGMLEKLSPALLAGMPAGSFQLLTGSTGNLLNELNCQDVVSFTGSAATALTLRANQHLQSQAIPFISEQDSLNASILGHDASADTPEFEQFIKEASREMTSKAGQKCTAIRRIIVPEALVSSVSDALRDRLGKIRIGDPALETTRMGALVSLQQKQDVLEKSQLIATQSTLIFGSDSVHVDGADADKGAFVSPMLFLCSDPDAATYVHEIEAFGPVSTIMPYRDTDHACELLNRGGGSLVASIVTRDTQFARDITLSSAAFHGRLYFNNRDSMKESKALHAANCHSGQRRHH